MDTPKYTLAALQAMPTLEEGWTADLKVDAPTVRVWLNRTGTDDGEEFDNGVVVEQLRDGKWVEIETYEAK